jgi:TPR repeat protein
MGIHRKHLASTLVLASALIAAGAPVLLPTQLEAQSQTAPTGIDPKLLSKASAGDKVAQWRVALTFEDGENVPQDFAKAAEWYLKAAEQGYAPAQLSIGTLYERGQGVKQDGAQAAAWYKKAADQGNEMAEELLGSLYDIGNSGVPQDYAKAAVWFLKAAEPGHQNSPWPNGLPLAQYMLGEYYEYGGRSLPQDFTLAAKWYQKAADQGLDSAQIHLSDLYYEGKGVPQSYAEAYFWIDLAVASAMGKDQEKYAEYRDTVALKLTTDELNKVQERATKWFADHPTKP